MPTGKYKRTKKIRIALIEAGKKRTDVTNCKICGKWVGKTHTCGINRDLSYLHTPESIAKRVSAVREGYKTGRLIHFWKGKHRDINTIQKLQEGRRKAHLEGKFKKKKGIRLNTGRTHFKKGQNTGVKNYRWKGGITPENKKRWCSLGYQNWRKSIFKRDNYTCKKCNSRGVNLNAHHIKPINSNPDLIYNLENGITYCKKCHIKHHKKYGW